LKDEYYAGHSFAWIQKFLDSVPERKWHRKAIAYCLAETINDLSIRGKTTKNLLLSHKALQRFDLWHKHIPRYLECFKQAGLIDYTIKKGAAPRLTLLFTDLRGKNRDSTTHHNSTYNKKNKRNRHLDQKAQVPRPKSIGYLDQKAQVQNSVKKEGGRVGRGRGRGGRGAGRARGVGGRRVVPRQVKGELAWFDAETGRRVS
jgi:hypothetical protein